MLQPLANYRLLVGPDVHLFFDLPFLVVTKVIEERKSFSKADHLVWQQPGHL